MGIINTFYGALLGVWLALLLSPPGMGWLSFFVIALVLMMVYMLHNFSEFPKIPERFWFLLLILYFSLYPPLVARIANEPKTPAIAFLSDPITWIPTFIVGSWALIIDLIKKRRLEDAHL